MNTIQKFIQKLETTIIQRSEDLYEIEDLCEEFENKPESKLAIKALFTFIENNDKEDLGSPGCIVKLLESFSEIYDTELYESICRKPALYNLWILNRYLNVLDDIHKKQKGINLLQQIANDNRQSNYIRERAADFLRNHHIK